MSLLDKMLKSGSIKQAQVLADSALFNAKDVIPTDIPIINVAFSGDIDGGLVPGLTILAGESKSFKTLLGLMCVKAYLRKYPDAVCLLYDSEFGVTPDYLKMNGIDTERVIHIPIEHVEQLKFDIVKRLEAIDRGDKVIIMLDSLGNLASKKEVEDALEEKSVADMSRAKAIRSLLRIITPHLTTKDIPAIVINHVYKEIGLFPKDVIPGGTAVTYAANQIFIITKAQIKDGTEISGYKFTIGIHKSRYVREKSKLPFEVNWESGINRYSGLLDIALEGNFLCKPKVGWYAEMDPETGEVLSDKNYRAKELDGKFWKPILDKPEFKEYIKRRYQIGATPLENFDYEDVEVDTIVNEEEAISND